MEVRSHRTYRFDVAPWDLWRAIARVDRYQDWWPWLRGLEGAGFSVGDRWACTVRPPVPYQLRFTVELVDVEIPTAVHAVVDGDLTGEATLRVRAVPDGTEAQLTSVLAPRTGPLRTLTRFAPWIARYGHDWVLDTGFDQFRRHALD